jgi:hypothetical protein
MRMLKKTQSFPPFTFFLYANVLICYSTLLQEIKKTAGIVFLVCGCFGAIVYWCAATLQPFKLYMHDGRGFDGYYVD